MFCVKFSFRFETKTGYEMDVKTFDKLLPASRPLFCLQKFYTANSIKVVFPKV